MTDTGFVLAALALLIAPGPTNLLLALAGAEAGAARVWRLLPVVWLSYLVVVLPLVWLGQGWLAAWPALDTVVKLAAAGWISWLALGLWRAGGRKGPTQVTVAKLALTTLLNPKALVFGLALLPGLDQPGFGWRLSLFLGLLTGSSLIWGLGGTLARQGPAAARLRLIQKVASGALLLVAVMLVQGLVNG